MVKLKKIAIIINGFLHDFAAGYWLAAMLTIHYLHDSHMKAVIIKPYVDSMESFFFWSSITAVVAIMATGAGRTFTYVDNWYGENAERVRRKALIVKHIILLFIFGTGYLILYPMVFD